MKDHRDEPDVAASGPLAGEHGALPDAAAPPALAAGPMSAARLMALQQSAGNAAVARLVSGGDPLVNEPPASTPTSATSPLEVVAPIEDDESEAEPLPAAAAPAPPASGVPGLPGLAPLADDAGAAQEGATNWPFRWPFGGGGSPAPTTGSGSGSGAPSATAVPAAGASRDDVMTALRGQSGSKARDPDWIRVVARFTAGTDDARLATNLLLFGPEASWPAPTAGALIPFDTAPLSAPNERIIFNLTWTPSGGQEFHEIVMTASDGTFIAAGAKTTTVKGLSTDNLDFRIPAAWTGTAITVKAEVRPRGNAAVLASQTWTFDKKAVFPTTMTQAGGTGEVALGTTYEYKLGPAIPRKTAPFYHHQTILETFPGGDCNIGPADLTDAFKAANPGLTDSKKINEHFFGGSGSNGTFTVSNDDKIWDQHGGILSQKADIEPHLKAWKEIHNDLFQIYEAEPGKPLGKYTIRRIIKADGSLALRKFKTP